MTLRRGLRHPLLHCLLLGTVAFAVSGAVREAPAPEQDTIHLGTAQVDTLKAQWRQQLGRPLTPTELRASLQATVDEQILIAEARKRGWDQTDPIVRRRLRDNLAFTEHADHGDGDLLAAARELGMPLLDPVVRKRLVLRMQALLRSRADTTPAEGELERYAEAASTATRRWTLTHVLRSGPDAEAELAAFKEEDALLPAQAAQVSEPFLAGNTFTDTTDRALAKTFGPDVVAQLATLPTGQWAGPVKSAFGQHLVWIEQRAQRQIVPDPDKAYLAWQARQETLALNHGLAQLRQQYHVRLGD